MDPGNGVPCTVGTDRVSIPIDSNNGLFEGIVLQPGQTYYIVANTFANPGFAAVNLNTTANTATR